MSGTLTWSGGYLSGPVTVASGGVLNIVGSTTKNLYGTLNNAGTINWSGTGNIRGYGYVFNNLLGGLFNIQSDAAFEYDNAPWNYTPYSFTNAGVWRKSGGSATTSVQNYSNFTNTGTIDVMAGTLSFANGYIQSAGSTTLSGGALNVTPVLQISGGELSGSGTITGDILSDGGVLRPGRDIGTMTVNGAFTQSGSGTLVLEIMGSQPGTQHDRFVVTGQAILGGTVEAQLMNGYQPALGLTFTAMSFGSRGGMFSFFNSPDFGEDLTFNIAWTATTFSMGVARTAFGDWKQTKFGANASDPAIVGPMADPNQNGTPNLLEFAFGMEPLTANQTEKLPTAIQVTVNTEDYLAICFRRLARRQLYCVRINEPVELATSRFSNLPGWRCCEQRRWHRNSDDSLHSPDARRGFFG